jgi:hypothetical protein
MKKYLASCSQYDLVIQVDFNANLDSTFEAVCLDTGDILSINGWLFTFEEVA